MDSATSAPTLDPTTWSHDRMLAAVLGRDSSCDGRFIFGVVSTGIYCLPSCKARNPKPENIRFFSDEDAARGAGLRACKRCRPDDFYARRDPDLEALEAAIAALRDDPASVAGVTELAARAGMGISKLHALTREHFHTTPGRLATAARMDRARDLLITTDLPVTEIAFDVGYESLSSFHDNFLRSTWMSPTDYRALPGSRAFTVRLPEDYPHRTVLARLSRDPNSLTERVRGDLWEVGTHLHGTPARLAARLGARHAEVEVHVSPSASATHEAKDPALEAHRQVLRSLGLTSDPAPFATVVAGLDEAIGGEASARLRARPTQRIQQTANRFECAIWAIAGQQVNLAFAYELVRTLVTLAAEPVGEGLHAPPTAEALARLELADLTSRRFSRSKAEYILGVAEKVASGELDLEALAAGPATRAEESLLAVRGLGPWSAGYILMRGFGFTDAVPWGDSGLLRGLTDLFGLDERPSRARSEELLAPFRPYRSFTVFHLWHLRET